MSSVQAQNCFFVAQLSRISVKTGWISDFHHYLECNKKYMECSESIWNEIKDIWNAIEIFGM